MKKYSFQNGKSYPELQILVGIIMIGIGRYKKSRSDKKVFQYLKERD